MKKMAQRPNGSPDDSSAAQAGVIGERSSIAPATPTTLGWRWLALPGLLIILGVAVVLGTAIGAVAISPVTTAAILLNATGLAHIPASWQASDQVILLQLRLPRVLGAGLVGAALGVAGALFQGVLRNPLADPMLLGASSGAALGATFAFVLPAAFTAYWFGFSVLALLAFVGALASVGLVYALATRHGRTPVVTLLLAGVAVSALLSAFQTLVITWNDRQGFHLRALYLWIAGGIRVLSWEQVLVVGALTAAGVVGALLLAPTMDALALGEEMAMHLGLRVEVYKRAVVGVAALLVAAAVSISGLVGFVGLIAPHLCRLTLGPRSVRVVWASALVGAIFVIVADLLARTVAAPAELPLGVLTALVGGPFFLSLLRHAGQRYRW